MYCKYCMAEIPAESRRCPVCGKELSRREPDYHLPPGTILNGRFLVGAALGEGGFGITYIGRDQKLEMKVAIKEYYPAGYAHRESVTAGVTCTGGKTGFFEKGRKRFLDEARVLAKFSDEDGIVNVRDFFAENNTAYIVMEYLDGITLRDHLKAHPLMSPEQAIHLLLPVMRSLERVHVHGLIHRDISPDNIMLLPDKVKLLDFGAARDVSGEKRSISVMLKPGYAPEEQYRSKGQQGPWTDVYALSATLYKCITGITPDDATQRVYQDELKAPSTLGIRIDPAVERALMKGLGVLQQDRYPSIGELLAGLQGEAPQYQSEGPTIETGQKGRSGADGSAQTIPPNDPDRTRTIPKKSRSRSQKKNGEAGQNVNPNPAGAGNVRQKPAKKGSKNAPSFIFLVLLIVVGVMFLRSGNHFGRNAQDVESKIQAADNSLYLHSADLTAANLKGLSGLTNLEYLTFSECTLNDEVLAKFADIPGRLKSLHIEDCVGCNDLSAISRQQGLRILSLSGNDLTQEQLGTIDFSVLTELYEIDLSNNPQLSNLTLLNGCESLSTLKANGCSITDLTLLPVKELSFLEISGNGVSDLSPLAAYTLYSLKANDNQISDLSVLSGMDNLHCLEVDENQIWSVAPLAGCETLEVISINANALTSLTGLESALRLETVAAAQNYLTDINGLTNCTRLTAVNLGGNQLGDISLLAKSADTLTRVYLNDNYLTSLEPLRGAVSLRILNFEGNGITSLEPLQGCAAMEYLYGGRNGLISTAGIEGMPRLKELYLPYNQISDTPGLETLDLSVSTTVDLSHNALASLTLVSGKEYWYLGLHDNPLMALNHIGGKAGSTLTFSYQAGMEYSVLDGVFTHFYILDCPEDQQLAVDDVLGYCTFSTSEEADQAMTKARSYMSYSSTSEAEAA